MIEPQQFTPELLEQLKAGDRQAFSELVERTSGKIYSLGLKMLGNEQDAEDMLQETYIKAYKALPGFENRSSVSTWLFRIAANEALMILRKRKNALPAFDIDAEADDDAQPVEIVDWCCLPESELASTETKNELNNAITKLSPVLRMVFLLRDMEGFSGAETAGILGINEDAVKTRLVRARLRLREELSVYFKERLR